MTRSLLALAILLTACGEDAKPVAEKGSAAPKTTTSSPSPVASAKPTATTTASATAAPAAAESASAAPSASAAASADAKPLVPAEEPAAEAPAAEAFEALDKEIAVKASGEQKCSTKVLNGWFEMKCVEDEKLVRATKVELKGGFDSSRMQFDAFESKTARFVAALPKSGEKCQARFYGPKMHEIWLTLEHEERGWKGQLTSNQP
jgi:hypothetical protein